MIKEMQRDCRIYLFIIQLIILKSVSVFAANDKVCDNLYGLTCAPGVYDDGTGKTELKTKAEKLLEDAKIHTELAAEAEKQIEAVLNDPENIHFRQLLLSSSGLAYDKSCTGADEKPEGRCLELLKKAGGDLVVRALDHEYKTTTNSSQNLEDEHALIDNEEFKEIIKKIESKSEQIINTKSKEEKLKNKLMPAAKRLLVEKIEQEIADPKTKELMIKKVNGIKLDNSDCPDESGKRTLKSYLQSNAFYFPHKNTVMFCKGYLKNTDSEFTIMQTLLHELAHSIDPCNVQRGPEAFRFQYKTKTFKDLLEEFPFSGVLQCLASEQALDMNNVRAELFKETQMQKNLAKGIDSGMMPGDSRGYAGTAYHTPQQLVCGEQQASFRQLGEGFSDWIAADLLPKYIAEEHPNLSEEQKRYGYSNVWRVLCSRGQSNPKLNSGTHPYTQKRVNHLLLAQPEIRRQMGCPPLDKSKVHCKTGMNTENTSSENKLIDEPRLSGGDPIQKSPEPKEGEQ